MHTFLENAKAARVMTAQAAGTDDTLTGSSVDTKGFGRVVFVAALGAVVATGTAKLKAQQSSDDGAADAFADLLGTSVAGADDDDNKLLILEISNPRERYIRPALVRATANVTVDSITAFLLEPNEAPVTQDTTVANSEIHHAPAEGTA